jgi:hypothetical protein
MVLDAVDVGLAGLATQGALKAIELAWNSFRDRRAGEDEARAGLRASQELALHYWGCLLHDLKPGCERVRYIIETSQARGVSLGPFDFTISDALMPDFCRVVPSPPLLAEFRNIISALKRVDFFQRAAVAQGIPRLDEAPLADNNVYFAAAGFAVDAGKKGIVQRFNKLVTIGHGIGKAVYGSDAWGGEPTGILPKEIDLSAPIDHSII